MKTKKQSKVEEEEEVDVDVGYQSFVKVAKSDSDDCMELPREKNGTVLLSTVQAQFPSAIGLKYKSASGGWRGIRAENNVLDPPYGGWGEDIYTITESVVLKRKASEESSEHARKSKKSSKLLEDLIVLGLPYATTEEELKDYFTSSCGDMAFCELKLDRETKKSRGFGFIRFRDEDAAEEALKGHHQISGRKLNIRLSKKQNEVPMKLFVGRLASGTTQNDVDEHFSDYGELTDVFVPNPFRGFGFITYASQEDATRVLNMSHILNGARLNVKAAEERAEDQGKRDGVGQRNPPFAQNTEKSPRFGQNTGYDNRWSSLLPAPVQQKDTVSELKDMLLTLINTQK